MADLFVVAPIVKCVDEVDQPFRVVSLVLASLVNWYGISRLHFAAGARVVMRGAGNRRRAAGAMYGWAGTLAGGSRLGHFLRGRPGTSANTSGSYGEERSPQSNMKNLRRPWTAEEDAQLRTLLEAGTPVRIAAVKLKRTTGAVKSRSSMIHVTRKRPPHGARTLRQA